MFLHNIQTTEVKSQRVQQDIFGRNAIEHNQPNMIQLALMEAEVYMRDIKLFERGSYNTLYKEGKLNTYTEHLLLEAVSSSVGDFFKKLWATVKIFFQKIFHFIGSIFTSRTAYVQKHQDKIRKGISNLDDDSEMEGQSPEHLKSMSELKGTLSGQALKITADAASNATDEALEKAIEDARTKYEDLRDKETLDKKQIAELAQSGMGYYLNKMYEKDKKVFVHLQKELSELEKNVGKNDTSNDNVGDKANASNEKFKNKTKDSSYQIPA